MRLWSGLILVCLGIDATSQSWQQQVDYSIACRLDDQAHQLETEMRILYHNNSPGELFSLMVHTWMNTFTQPSTPYSKQLENLGIDRRFRLKPDEQGGYTQLQFFYKGKLLTYQFTDQTHEILELVLPEGIKPGQTINLQVNFTLKIPKNISRGGRLDQAYQMTQWYPKLALFDSLGWHTMPYLEFGEYFNDFGDYEVSIELPSNYLVASTGNLEDEQEKKFLLRYADSCKQNGGNLFNKTNEYPLSGMEYKKVKFTARQVIDFAWFADKRFMVNYQPLKLKDKSIELWAFFYPANKGVWAQATQYTAQAVQYFNTLVGDYPYPQVTVVECPRAGSDAMEYPMITLIDQYYGQPLELEKVIVHEVGHNWFQSILATDERTQAWMDEGLVTYYEQRYFKNNQQPGIFSDAPIPLHTDYDPVPDFDWYIQANRHQDKPSAGRSDNYTIREYIQSIYEKPAKGIKLMEKQLGTARFDQLMKSYFNQWKFGHPQDHDLLNLFQQYGIDWYDSLYLFDAFKVDCSISASGEPSCFWVKHNAGFTFPIEIAGYRKNRKIYSRILMVPAIGDTLCISTDSLDYILLDPEFCLPEIKRTNNIYRLNSSVYVPKKSTLRFLGGIDHSLTRETYLLPAVGYNFYDGLMVGLGLHNLTLPSKSLRYAAVIGYGLRSKNPVGLGGIDYTLPLTSKSLDNLNFSLESRHFTFNRDTHYLTNDRYFKLAPSVQLKFKTGKPHAGKFLEYRWIYIKQWYAEGIQFENRIFENRNRSYAIHELKYSYINKKSLFPVEWVITGELNRGYTKLHTQYAFELPYSGAKKQVEFNFFGGIQSIQAGNKVSSAFLLNGITGSGYFQRDYKMDELLFGRSEQTGSLSQQIYQKDAGFKNLTNVGSSTTWMLAGGVRTTIPGFLPVRPYVQGALVPREAGQPVKFFYSSGVAVILIPRIFEIYLPAWESKQITSGTVYQERNSYLKKCSFTFNMNLFNPFKWLDKVAQ